jgi:predicted RNA-binding Zn-ribbon protein involved in translation (DUF1610 family)
MAYTCKNCGALADEPGHLCNPCDDVTACTFCGEEEVDSVHMCREKMKAMHYVCENCGRVAVEGKHLCKPKAIV